jgi:anhydro-N-acetylmuramic acid kinase
MVEVTGPSDHPQVKLRAFITAPYPAHLRGRLLRVASGEASTSAEISELNFLTGESFARAALAVCRMARVRPQELAAIGSHGQTIFHQGKAITALQAHGTASTVPSTLQIGEPAVIAERTGSRVVADFRAADMAAGGEGAPLVPLVDYLLLRDSKVGVIALNIGGIANLTVIPPGARQEEVYGFDTGPGNMVIDAVARDGTGGRKRFDRDGRMASRGIVIDEILKSALRLPFFRRRPPKSAGREQFGAEFVSQYFRAGQGASINDLLATATELTARSIALAIRRFVPFGKHAWQMVVSGGGVHNRFLLERLAAHLPTVSICTSDDFGLPADAKEAMAFALLADRTLHGLPGNLPRVTGACRSVVLGKRVEPYALPEKENRLL